MDFLQIGIVLHRFYSSNPKSLLPPLSAQKQNFQIRLKLFRASITWILVLFARKAKCVGLQFFPQSDRWTRHESCSTPQLHYQLSTQRKSRGVCHFSPETPIFTASPLHSNTFSTWLFLSITCFDNSQHPKAHSKTDVDCPYLHPQFRSTSFYTTVRLSSKHC